MKRVARVLAGVALGLALAGAARAETPAFAGRGEMNGIVFTDYAGFERAWKQVSVRYRTDTGEQRFTYANDKAFAALEAESADFPDGAVFAKIGFMTEEDPLFKSSRVPSGTLRYQIMVRDRAKYASTGGWGYALFDANRVTMERDPTSEAKACYACHQLARERGEVFSTALKLNPFVNTAAAAKPETVPEAALARLQFADQPFKGLPEELKKALPSASAIRAVQGTLREHVFKGTIDEIRPSLIDEVKRTGRAAALVSSNGPHFAAVFRDRARANCSKEKSLKSVFSTTIPSGGSGNAPLFVVAFQELCL